MNRPTAKYVMTMTWLIKDPPAADSTDSTTEPAANYMR
jgi:hypothetical protein